MKRILAVITLAVLCIAAGAKERTIKILAIGNSFSWDSVEQNLHQIADADGTTLIIGNMYIGGCSIEHHVNNLRNDLPEYRYMKISADGSEEGTAAVSKEDRKLIQKAVHKACRSINVLPY